MSQRYTPPTTCVRIDRDLYVDLTRRAGELSAATGRVVPIADIASASVRRGLDSVTTDDVRESEPPPRAA